MSISVVVEPSAGASKRCKLQPLAQSICSYSLLELDAVMVKQMARNCVGAVREKGGRSEYQIGAEHEEALACSPVYGLAAEAKDVEVVGAHDG